MNRQYSLTEPFLYTNIYASAKVHTKIWVSILALIREKLMKVLIPEAAFYRPHPVVVSDVHEAHHHITICTIQDGIALQEQSTVAMEQCRAQCTENHAVELLCRKGTG